MTPLSSRDTSSLQSEGVLELSGLTVSRDDFEVRAHLRVRPGQRVAWVGRSGCGKTTLLRAVAGLESPSSGRVWIQGQDVTSLPAEKRNFGFVFQDLALFPALSVAQNLDFGLRVRGFSQRERDRRMAHWVERFGLKGRERDPVSQLSGGERQRVALIRTWLTEPRVLLLDEPFSALDPALRFEFRQALLEVLQRHPVPVIWVTHDGADLDHFATDRLEVKERESGRIREFSAGEE